MRDQVSHPYKTTCKMKYVHALIFTFLDSKLEDIRLWPNNSEHSTCSSFLHEFNFDLLGVVPKCLNGWPPQSTS
jgi:hypothetical protein